MKPHRLILVALLALSASSRAQTPMKLEQTIPLPGLKEGDFDHFAVDLAGQRLFLTAEKNAAVLNWLRSPFLKKPNEMGHSRWTKPITGYSL